MPERKKNDANMNDLYQLADITQQLAEKSRLNAASPVKVLMMPEVAPDVDDEERPAIRQSACIAAKAKAHANLLCVKRSNADAMFSPL